MPHQPLCLCWRSELLSLLRSPRLRSTERPTETEEMFRPLPVTPSSTRMQSSLPDPRRTEPKLPLDDQSAEPTQTWVRLSMTRHLYEIEPLPSRPHGWNR